MGSGYPIIYGECGSGPKTFVVYGHYDVQPVGQLDRTGLRDRLRRRSIDGKLYARGAANSKGDLIARLAAVEAYQKTFGKLPVTLRFHRRRRRRTGQSQSLSVHHRDTLRCCEPMVASGTKVRATPKRTRSSVWVSRGLHFSSCARFGARSDLHSKWGAIVPNPAWRLVQALATITSPKGVITIDGFSSHIAPISDEDAEVLKAIELDEAGLKSEFRIGGWVRAMKGPTLVKEHIFGPTCTICGIHTGHTEAGAKTVLPSMAMARLDFRLVPDLTAKIVVELVARASRRAGIQRHRDYRTGQCAAREVVGEVARGARSDRVDAGSLWPPPLIYPMDPSSGPVGAVCGVSEPADAGGFVRYQLRRIESSWTRRKHSRRRFF